MINPGMIYRTTATCPNRERENVCERPRADLSYCRPVYRQKAEKLNMRDDVSNWFDGIGGSMSHLLENFKPFRMEVIKMA